MKKYLIDFGLCLFFFAGFGTTQVSAAFPSFTADETYKDCRNNENGYWINIIGEKEEKHCLAKDSCAGLEISYKTEGDKDIDIKGGFFVVKKDDVTCEGKLRCTIDDKKITVQCYESDNFIKKIYESSDFCKIDSSKVITTIVDIDNPRESSPEWYCPETSDIYVDNINPYDHSGDYFENNLKDVYKYTPTESELIKNCSLRMFALMKSCNEISQQKSGKRDKLEQLRRDFYTKQTILGWREMITATGIKALNQWNSISNSSFETICGNADKTNCSNDVYKDFKEPKKGAYEAVQKWLKTSDVTRYNQTPAEYFRQLAKEKWDSEATAKGVLETKSEVMWGAIEEADKKTLENKMGKVYIANDFKFGDNEWSDGETDGKTFSTLSKNVGIDEDSAKKIAKYVSDRNMSLNISVSIGQSNGVNIGKYLSVTNTSKESKLTIFKNESKDDINVFDKIIRLAVRTMGTLATLLLIISGVMMIISQGDDNQLEKAKTVFIYTLLGLAVGFLSYTIVRFIIDTLLS